MCAMLASTGQSHRLCGDAPGSAGASSQRHDHHAADVDLLRRIADRLLDTSDERQRFFRSNAQYRDAGVTDYFFGTAGGNCDPDRLFRVLRWGGQFIFASHSPRETTELLERYRDATGFTIDIEPQTIDAPRTLRLGRFTATLPMLARRHHFFVARKTLITRPDEPTDRYSYDVRLTRNGTPSRYVVLKQVPTLDHACRRLAARFPDQPDGAIIRSARKLVDKVFPVFLTREAALLKIVQKHLPEAYRHRFPTVLDIEQDERGLVQRMKLNWLRLGGETLPHREFARQAADCLRVLHDAVGVIHLDLRLDNLVVTPGGVGILDFGSAVRVGEDFSNNPMLDTLFSELLSTSQIQRDLRRMIRRGKVTSRLFTGAEQRIDKAVDLFYLVLQMNNPHVNPDFRGLVHYDRESGDARSLARLSRRVLNPSNPAAPEFRTAADVLRAIEHLD
jgi:hypothetical protein